MSINFGRAIQIESYTDRCIHPEYNWRKLHPQVKAIGDCIKGKPNSIYDKETSRKISEFFRTLLGDYNSKSGVVVRKVDGKNYIFSGKEAVKAREIIANAQTEFEELEARYAAGPDENSTQSEIVELSSEKLHKIYRQNVFLRRDKKLLELTENGEFKKPNSRIILDSNDDKRVSQIRYKSTSFDANRELIQKNAQIQL